MSQENFGICIAGMGDCGTKITQVTQNFNTTVSENIKNTMINKNTTNNFMAGTSQNFQIKGLSCGGDLNISNIQQKAVISIDFSALDESVDKTTFDTMMKAAVQSAVERNNDIKQEFLSTGSEVNQTTTNISTNINRVVSNDVYNDFKANLIKMKANQDIGIIDVAAVGTCNINDIKQDIQLDLVVKTIASKLTENFAKLVQDNQTSLKDVSKTKVESTGMFGDLGRALSGVIDSFTGPFRWIAILIGGAVIISVLGVAIWRVVAAVKGNAAAGRPQSISGVIRATSDAAGKLRSSKPGRSRSKPTGGTSVVPSLDLSKDIPSGETMYGGW